MARVRRNPAFMAEMRRKENHRQWSQQAAFRGKAAIQSFAPRETGFLKQNIRTTEFLGRDDMPTVRYEAIADYSVYQEVGTGLYGPLHRWITPKVAQALSWIDSTTGDRRFAKRVRGTRPRRYFRRGMETVFGRSRVRYYGVSRGSRFER